MANRVPVGSSFSEPKDITTEAAFHGATIHPTRAQIPQFPPLCGHSPSPRCCPGSPRHTPDALAPLCSTAGQILSRRNTKNLFFFFTRPTTEPELTAKRARRELSHTLLRVRMVAGFKGHMVQLPVVRPSLTPTEITTNSALFIDICVQHGGDKSKQPHRKFRCTFPVWPAYVQCKRPLQSPAGPMSVSEFMILC